MVQVKISEVASNRSLIVDNSATITIGRGFLDCNDKRVSKNHGELTVIGNELRVKAIHTNPIFYKHASEPYKVLRTDCEILLRDRDLFSFLPMPNPEYEVKIESNDDDNNAAGGFRIRNVGEINENLEAGSISTSLSQIFGRDEESGNNRNNVPDTTEARDDPDRTPSPENLRPPTTNHQMSPETSNTASKRPLQDDKSEGEGSSSPKRARTNEPQTDDSVPSSSDRAVAAIDEVVQNIKPDPDSTTTPTASNPLPSTSSVKPDPDAAAVKVEAKPDPNLRKSCEFGIRCFRFSADHRREFAHPQDADYRRPNFPDPPAGTPACPWNSSCYRRNPAHFQSLSHPPSSVYTTSTTTTPSAVTTAMPMQQSNVQQNSNYNQISDEEDADDDSERDLNDSGSDRDDGESNFDDSDADADFMVAGEFIDDEDDDNDEDDETEENNLEE